MQPSGHKIPIAAKLSRGLACRFSAFYRLDEGLFDECLDGMPAYAACIISGIDPGSRQYEVSYFLPQGNFFDKAKLKGLFAKAYNLELIFFTSTLDGVPLFGLPGISTTRLSAVDQVSLCNALISAESTGTRLFRELIVNATLEKLSLYVLRELSESQPEIFSGLNDYFSNARLATILVHIHKKLEQEVSLESLANMVELSPDYISQFFKRCLGMSIQAYLIEQRVSKGFFTLISTSDAISIISDSTGFVDQAYFNRRFKIIFGMNPLRVRKKYQLLFISQAGALMSSAKW